MTIEITTLTDSESDSWNNYVERAPQASPFHRYEALNLLAQETESKLYTLIGFKGQEPVGLLPLFESKQGPFRQVASPPELEVFSLGPALLNFRKLKQRKGERRHQQFIEGCLDWIEEHLNPDSVDIRTVTGYNDLRPFIWRGYDVSPSYTYVVDLTPDEDELLMSFSSDARSNIRDDMNESVDIQHCGIEGIEPIVGRIRDRHREQNKSYSLTPQFVEALYRRLPVGVMRVYTVQVEEETVGGMITFEQNETVYRWQGGAKTGSDLPANDILDWQIMSDAKSRGFTRYDLVGANSPRLCRYKSKFDPDPVEYYVATRRTGRMQAVMGAYHLLPDHLRVI